MNRRKALAAILSAATVGTVGASFIAGTAPLIASATTQDTPMLDAILRAGQLMDEQDLLATDRHVIMTVRQLEQLKREFPSAPWEIPAEPKGSRGVPVGMLDRFTLRVVANNNLKACACGHSKFPYSWRFFEIDA